MRTEMFRHLVFLRETSARAEKPRTLASIAAGKALPDKPPEFSWHDYAIFLLSMAAEIEHSLMVQYLYSGWSLQGPAVPEPHRNEVLSWQRIVLGIAKEEMGHLITVQNVLRLLGGPMHLDREDFPWISGFYPYAFSLEPASRDTLAKYLVAESPEIWPDSVPAAEKAEIERLAATDAHMKVARVGTLYQTLIDLIDDSDRLPDSAFCGETYPRQASWDDWGRGYAPGTRGDTPATSPDVLVLRAANRSQASVALRAVAQQGEAPQFIAADKEDSHFSRFLKVWRGITAATGWSPAIALPVNPIVPGPGATGRGAVITNPESAGWGELFNLRYRMLLTWLGHAFELGGTMPPDAPPGRRGLALNRIYNEMYTLRAVAGLMARRPLDNDPAAPSGPPFQMPYTLNFPARERDFWRLHLDLLDAAHDQTARLPATGSDGTAFIVLLRAADAEARREVETILRGGTIR